MTRGCFAGKLLQRAPDRVVAAVFCQTVGHLPQDPRVMYRHGKENWVPDLIKGRPEVSIDMIETYLHNLYAIQPDFLYSVAREFIRGSPTPCCRMTCQHIHCRRRSMLLRWRPTRRSRSCRGKSRRS